MIEIRCVNDIKELEAKGLVPEELIEMLTQDLQVIKEYSDEDEEYSFEEFNTDYTGNGYIAILDGTESVEDLEDRLGLTGGLTQVIPEGAENHSYDGDKWTRIVVIYNDSYGMILWLKNYDGFDDYVVSDRADVDYEKAPF